MASPSSFTSRNYKYKVFSSFHGPDVRQTFLAHLRKQFNSSAITMFDDQGIERSAIIAPSLTEAIRESRISIVILSKKYASSGWCLDELLEILECKKAMGQRVMTIFYGVDPSDVRNQTGDFGNAFNKTCRRKAKEKREKWSQALTYVGNIAGEHFQIWENEAKKIEKIAKDVVDKLNATPSMDFDGMVGLETHLREMKSLLDLEYDGVKMVAITGPAGIGKTTIARALHSLLSSKFQLTFFVDNLRESYPKGFDEYGLKLRLQEEFISKVLNQNDMRISHLRAVKDNLCDQKVLILLDDVNNLNQLEAMAGDISWFGPGSRIVVTTKNKELLQQHGINNTYHVGFPNGDQALEILCRYAFRQSYPRSSFKELAGRVTWLCGSLPLGLRVVGSSLRGKNEDEWKEVICRLETILDHQDIEEVLRVGYESLHETEQSLFLHIAVFFNYEGGDLVNAMLADNNLDIKHGLKILVNRSLIYISTEGVVVMHKLLQQMGRQAINRQKPWKRRILINAEEICDVLEDDKGTIDGGVSGISFDISDIYELSISKSALKGMRNLRFLKVYNRRYKGNDIIHIPEELEFPRRLRLLQWQAYPNKCLPPTFHTEYLVKLYMRYSKLEYLWQGAQPLSNLKEIDLGGSRQLKELPDLTHATNLEKLHLGFCESLVEIPSSFSYFQKLQKLVMRDCKSLQVIPADLNLASLDDVSMEGCSKLRNFPVISTHMTNMSISDTLVEDLPAPIRLCSRLQALILYHNGKLKGLTHFPTSLVRLDLSYTDIERIPDSIKALSGLQRLYVHGCSKLTSLPELPHSLRTLWANDCESLETVFCPFYSPTVEFFFTNCLKLEQQARRNILKESIGDGFIHLPGRDVPAEFDHRARGNSLTICLDDKMPQHVKFPICLVISPNNHIKKYSPQAVVCHRIVNGNVEPRDEVGNGYIDVSGGTEHLFTFIADLRYFHSGEVSSEIVFEFSSKYGNFDVTECGAKIIPEEIFQNNRYEPLEDDNDRAQEVICDLEENDDLEEDRTDCWSWLILCSDFVTNIGSVISGRR